MQQNSWHAAQERDLQVASTGKGINAGKYFTAPSQSSPKRPKGRGPIKTSSANNSKPPINPGLLELIRSKREFHWKPTVAERKQGFPGWHQRGYLPHFDAPGVTQFVTLQLDDSFPVRNRREWESILQEPNHSLLRRKIEAALDRGHGQCWLRQPDVARSGFISV